MTTSSPTSDPTDPTATIPAAGAWMHHMRRGAWDHAWNVSDAVLRAHAGQTCWDRPRHEQWIWDGTPLAGRRVLVRCYHGLGDTLMFARFVPGLRAVAAEVTLWAQPALLPLLATMRGVGPLLPLHDGVPDVAYDVDVEVMELAHVRRATPATLPPPPAFDLGSAAPVGADDDRRDDGRLRVGLVWACGDWDHAIRAIPVAALTPLATVPGVALHLLQRGPALADAPEGFGIVSGCDEILAAARVVRTLDLVISVDTMPAHLAGALGVPVWTLLPHAADWRWGDDPDRTPWYPTMRLFRQAHPGDWAGVVARVASELGRLAASHVPRRPRPEPRLSSVNS